MYFPCRKPTGKVALRSVDGGFGRRWDSLARGKELGKKSDQLEESPGNEGPVCSMPDATDKEDESNVAHMAGMAAT